MREIGRSGPTDPKEDYRREVCELKALNDRDDEGVPEYGDGQFQVFVEMVPGTR